MKDKHLFLLCPPYSGATILWKLISSSPNVTALPNDLTKPIFLGKSPSNLICAFEIENHFPSSYFILMLKNPYTFCEGIIRRQNGKNISIKNVTENWILLAKSQIKNMERLENTIGFSYESLIEDTQYIVDLILKFIPSLEHLDINILLKTKSVTGSYPKKLFSNIVYKFSSLSGRELYEVNSVLKCYPEVMDYFGYQYIYPTISQKISHLLSKSRSAFTTINFKFTQ